METVFGLNDIITEIQRAKEVRVWSNIFGDEGVYVKVVKKDLIQNIQREQDCYNLTIKAREKDGILYIN